MPKTTSAHATTREDDKIYLVRRRICLAMVCTFVLSLALITALSLFFFYYFLELILGLTIENIFIAHTYYIVNDII